MRTLAALALAAMLLTGCQAAPSNTTTVVCPSIVEYDRATQQRAAQELRRMPADAELPRMFADYGRLRDQVRACR